MSIRVLVIEDDERIAGVVVRGLRAEGRRRSRGERRDRLAGPEGRRLGRRGARLVADTDYPPMRTTPCCRSGTRGALDQTSLGASLS